MKASAVHFTSAAEFLAATAPFLETREVENTLLLGVAQQAASDPNAYGESFFGAAVRRGGALAAAALQVGRYPAVLSRAEPEDVRAIAALVRQARPSITGFVGPKETAAAFADIWQRETGERAVVHMQQRLYQLTAVEPVPAAPGQLREATEADRALLTRWMERFLIDVGMAGGGADSPQLFDQRLKARSLFVWDDGEPASMASWSGRTTHGVRVNFVYTPPEKRGRGYATACVAALSQRLLAEGCAFCCLFTDLANPTSNSIYQRIGYRPVCDSAEYRLPRGAL
jgi:predicted GNAT family acetyltransferase